MSTQVLTSFCMCAVESVIIGCITSCCGSGIEKRVLLRVVKLHKKMIKHSSLQYKTFTSLAATGNERLIKQDSVLEEKTV